MTSPAALPASAGDVASLTSHGQAWDEELGHLLLARASAPDSSDGEMPSAMGGERWVSHASARLLGPATAVVLSCAVCALAAAFLSGGLGSELERAPSVTTVNVITGLASAATSKAPYCGPASGADEETLNDFGTGISGMEKAGWKFDSEWEGATQYRPDITCDKCSGVNPKSYWGWRNSGIGRVSLALKGSGTAVLNFGNAYDEGEVVVGFTGGKLLGKAYANTPSTTIVFNFEDGDVLNFGEGHPTGIVVINSISFLKCYEGAPPPISLNSWWSPANPFPDACGYYSRATEAEVNKFDGGVDALEKVGWEFSKDFSEDYKYRPDLPGNCEDRCVAPNGNSYWGWDFPGNGAIRLRFRGAGKARIDFGNSYFDGKVKAYVHGDRVLPSGKYFRHDVDVAYANTPSMNGTFDFEDGHWIVMKEYDPRAVLVVNRITILECKVAGVTAASNAIESDLRAALGAVAAALPKGTSTSGKVAALEALLNTSGPKVDDLPGVAGLMNATGASSPKELVFLLPGVFSDSGSPKVITPLKGIDVPSLGLPGMPSVNASLPSLPSLNASLPGLPSVHLPSVNASLPGLPSVDLPSVNASLPGLSTGSDISLPSSPSATPGSLPNSIPSVSLPGLPAMSVDLPNDLVVANASLPAIMVLPNGTKVTLPHGVAGLEEESSVDMPGVPDDLENESMVSNASKLNLSRTP